MEWSNNYNPFFGYKIQVVQAYSQSTCQCQCQCTPEVCGWRDCNCSPQNRAFFFFEKEFAGAGFPKRPSENHFPMQIVLPKMSKSHPYIPLDDCILPPLLLQWPVEDRLRPGWFSVIFFPVPNGLSDQIWGFPYQNTVQMSQNKMRPFTPPPTIAKNQKKTQTPGGGPCDQIF